MNTFINAQIEGWKLSRHMIESLHIIITARGSREQHQCDKRESYFHDQNKRFSKTYHKYTF
jgi:hypothetical protein